MRAEVLLVDGDADSRLALTLALTRQGHKTDSRAELNGALPPPPDVAILDIAGPTQESLRDLIRLRPLPGWEDVPIICMSRHDPILLRVQALDLGADDFVLKPIYPDELVARVGAQLRRARRAAALLSQSHVDALTGLLNRRGSQEALHKALAWAARANEPCSLLMLDVDGLKQVNDRLGHAAGDALISSVGEALKLAVRREDSVGRLGGDEFMVVLPRADEASAARVCQRIDSLLEVVSLPGVATVRASMGFVASAPNEYTAEAMLELADQRMYAAKRQRRLRAA